MDHPLRKQEQSELRKRVIRFLKNSLNVKRDSNIVFVCGGNEDKHLRSLFRDAFSLLLDDYVFFTPESAIENINNSELDKPFDLADFEEMISEISHSIVVFPEAPGSYTETGYFSAIEKIARKVILVMNNKFQDRDSFLSLGPGSKIEKLSIFRPIIQLDYENPNFSLISSRIRERSFRHNKKQLELSQYAALTKYEKACIVQYVVSFFNITTVDDIIFFMRGLFDARISETEVRLLVGILAGAKYIEKAGEYGHYRKPFEKKELLEVRDGAKNEFSSIRVEMAAVYEGASRDFNIVLGID